MNFTFIVALIPRAWSNPLANAISDLKAAQLENLSQFLSYHRGSPLKPLD